MLENSLVPASLLEMPASLFEIIWRMINLCTTASLTMWTLTTSLCLPLKNSLLGLKLWRWSLDISLPFPQVAGLLNKTTFPSQPILSLEY